MRRGRPGTGRRGRRRAAFVVRLEGGGASGVSHEPARLQLGDVAADAVGLGRVGRDHLVDVQHEIAGDGRPLRMDAVALGGPFQLLDGRIDDPNAGWKGTGLWVANDTRAVWHGERGTDSRSLESEEQLLTITLEEALVVVGGVEEPAAPDRVARRGTVHRQRRKRDLVVDTNVRVTVQIANRRAVIGDPTKGRCQGGHHHLQRRLARPPMLRPKCRCEALVGRVDQRACACPGTTNTGTGLCLTKR